MTKKVRSPKDIKLRTGRFATRTNKPFLGKLNRPLPPGMRKSKQLKGRQEGFTLNNDTLDSMTLL